MSLGVPARHASSPDGSGINVPQNSALNVPRFARHLVFHLVGGTALIMVCCAVGWFVLDESLVGAVRHAFANRESAATVVAALRAAAGVMIVSIVLTTGFLYWYVRQIARLARQLGSALHAVGVGRLDVHIQTSLNDEFAQLARAFNQMVEHLRALITAVQHSGTEITASAIEIAATAREQQSTSSEIASTTAAVSAKATEISATSHELANNMKTVAEVAEQTATLADAGQSGLTRMEGMMQQINTTSASITEQLATLRDKANDITVMVTTIIKVADQTNLLSLNAEIEAEKAGEYGRGFTVVAAEIRRLADQTAEATSDIERIVLEMQSSVTTGVQRIDQFAGDVQQGVEVSSHVSQGLSEIIRHVQQLTPNVETVNTGMQSQAASAQHISDALTQLGAAAKQTAESQAQSYRAIQQLSEASRTLHAGISRFMMGAPYEA